MNLEEKCYIYIIIKIGINTYGICIKEGEIIHIQFERERDKMTDILVTENGQSLFESIKQINSYGIEYWDARELMTILDYKQWRRFEEIINKAKISCEASHNVVLDHFANVGKMVTIGSNSQRELKNYHLTRYACYLIAQNGDPRKKAIALAQTYFATQTRKQELDEQISHDMERLAIRRELVEHNKKLMDSAKDAGVISTVEYATFQNFGYKGLYNGLTAGDIHKRKGLKKSQRILDHMDSTELAANLFRATQAREKLQRENIKNKEQANRTHFAVGKAVRNTI